MSRLAVLHQDDLSETGMCRVEVEGRAILLARIDGEIRAVDDVCPHHGASLSAGVLRDGCVTCPAHLWRFRLTDGTRVGRPDVRIPTYDVAITDEGWIEIDLPAAPAKMTLREALLAQARRGPVS
jgi:nitrite reductase (NADH) small subunit